MTPCTCHPGNVCASAASCAAARRVEFGENEMPEFVTAIDYADNPNDTTTNMIDVRVPIGTRLALQSQPAAAGVSDEAIDLVGNELARKHAVYLTRESVRDLLARAILALRPQSESERVEAIMAHVHDLYAELGLKWGDNPFLALSRLRPQAVPMTDEQAKQFLKQSDLLDMFLHIGWYSAPRKGFDQHALSLIRAIEAHHGITAQGAQGEQA